jgi:phosphoribosylanthranilate isomerase
MQAVRVKICGLTRPEDVVNAVDAGADALGLVFAPSPRQLTVAQAEELIEHIPERCLRVALFMDQEAELIEAVLKVLKIDLLQFHGDEENHFCTRFGLPFIKAISMLHEDPEGLLLSYPDAAGMLLDSHAPGGAGGTGETFDWTRRVGSEKPLWLAGGLNPDNVASAVKQFRPFAVDVSSGVESSPGIKRDDLVKNFIQNAKQAHHEPAR